MSTVHDHRSYQGPRPDLLSQLRSPRKVLDVGCNNGAVARALKQHHPNALVWGIEINPDALSKALPDLEHGWVADLDSTDVDALLGPLTFDHIKADVVQRQAALITHSQPSHRQHRSIVMM